MIITPVCRQGYSLASCCTANLSASRLPYVAWMQLVCLAKIRLLLVVILLMYGMDMMLGGRIFHQVIPYGFTTKALLMPTLNLIAMLAMKMLVCGNGNRVTDLLLCVFWIYAGHPHLEGLVLVGSLILNMPNHLLALVMMNEEVSKLSLVKRIVLVNLAKVLLAGMLELILHGSRVIAGLSAYARDEFDVFNELSVCLHFFSFDIWCMVCM